MKIKPNDLQALEDAIKPFDVPETRLAYLTGNFPRADKVKDLDKRYRWDLLYMSRLKIGDGAGMQGDINLYAYMDDSHIDTALRSFIKPLEHQT